MESRPYIIDPFAIPDELKPFLAKFFKAQSRKIQSIERDVVYPFENASFVFTHDIYPHASVNDAWCADVLAHDSFYHNDFTTGRKVIAVIHPASKHKPNESALTVQPKARRCYFFLAPELHSRLDIFKRFPGRRPRFFLFNNTNIVSQIVQGQSLFEYLNNERTFAGKVLSSPQRFRMIISLIRECMNYHLQSVCNREITVKDIVYDERNNQTQFLSFRLAKMLNDTSLSSGGNANAVFGAPEEFTSQSSGKLITIEDYKKRNSIISRASLPADVFMVGFVSINIWRHVYKNHRANAPFTDYYLQRAELGWLVEPECFEKIYDLLPEERQAILYISNLILNPTEPDKRPTMNECFYHYQQLYLNYRMKRIDDEIVRERLFSANMIAHALHLELLAIAGNSILLNDCRNKIKELALKPQQLFKVFQQKLERNKKDYLSAILMQKLPSLQAALNIQAAATINDFLDKLSALVNPVKLLHLMRQYLSAVEDHPDAIAEVLEYCDLRCLFGVESKQELFEKTQQILNHHAAMLQLFQQHEHEFREDLEDLKYQLMNDTITLDNLDKQAVHIQRKFGKLEIAHPDNFRLRNR